MNKGKGNHYKFWHSPIALVVIFCLVVLFGYKIIDLIQKEKETAHKKELVLEEIENLRKREFALSNDISKLETEAGQEEIIREKYQVAKPNEKMVIIVDDDGKDDLSPENDKARHGFIEWLKKFFKR
ncbi:MAG: septum formation initiator family protein [Candidatus Paceibacterota bacterium]|jgi:cell division protein FtsB